MKSVGVLLITLCGIVAVYVVVADAANLGLFSEEDDDYMYRDVIDPDLFTDDTITALLEMHERQRTYSGVVMKGRKGGAKGEKKKAKKEEKKKLEAGNAKDETKQEAMRQFNEVIQKVKQNGGITCKNLAKKFKGAYCKMTHKQADAYSGVAKGLQKMCPCPNGDHKLGRKGGDLMSCMMGVLAGFSAVPKSVPKPVQKRLRGAFLGLLAAMSEHSFAGARRAERTLKGSKGKKAGKKAKSASFLQVGETSEKKKKKKKKNKEDGGAKKGAKGKKGRALKGGVYFKGFVKLCAAENARCEGERNKERTKKKQAQNVVLNSLGPAAKKKFLAKKAKQKKREARAAKEDAKAEKVRAKAKAKQDKLLGGKQADLNKKLEAETKKKDECMKKCKEKKGKAKAKCTKKCDKIGAPKEESGVKGKKKKRRKKKSEE